MASDNIAQIQDMDEFRRREELFRTDPAARADAINQLALVGGTTAMDIARRIRSRLLSDDIMAQLNGMQNFSKTEIYSVLKEAIIRASRAPEGEVERVMKDHFPDAPDGGRGSKTDVSSLGDDFSSTLSIGGADNFDQIKNMDEFNERERIYNNSAARDKMIEKLVNCEEKLQDITKRIMSRLLANRVMEQYTFKNFSATNIFSVLKEAIKQASRAPDNDVENAMAVYLNNARHRKDGRQNEQS